MCRGCGHATLTASTEATRSIFSYLEQVFHAEPLHTSAKHALFLKQVFHAEPLHTSAKHARIPYSI